MKLTTADSVIMCFRIFSNFLHKDEILKVLVVRHRSLHIDAIHDQNTIVAV